MSESQNESTAPHWGIVGGGMMGLALAHRLAAYGQRVTILESGPEIGGLASAWQIGDVVWDRHYHVTLLSDLRFRALLKELDLEHEMRWVETKTGFYADGCLHSMSNSLEFLRFPPLTLVEKFRLGLTIFAASKIKNWRRLENILVADWLRKWSGAGTFEKIWQPLLEAKLGQTYRRVSAAFIWATISRMYRARQSGLKKEMFGYVPGGYARILARFAETLRDKKVDLQLNQKATQIVSEPDGTVRVSLAEEEDQRFDRLVLTAPSPAIAQLCPQMDEQERSQHERIEYLGILCASVLLKKRLSPYYVTNITDRDLPFTAVIEMTTLVDPQELNGHHLVYLPRYVSSDDPAWHWSDETLEKTFIAALQRMISDFHPSDVEAFRVSRIGRVMALPTLNYSEQLPSVVTKIPNVFAVNSAQIVKGTLNVNEVVEVADKAMDDHLVCWTDPNYSTTSNLYARNKSDDETSCELVARS